MSSGNNANLVAAGKRFRGGPTAVSDQSHLPGISPLCHPGDDPSSVRSGGLDWSPWVPIAVSFGAARGEGLYRIRRAGHALLTYVGEGVIASRLAAHLAKAADARQRQHDHFAATDLVCSYVSGLWSKPQRLELENDLLANHMELLDVPPAAQFLG